MSATDLDAGDTLTYSLEGTDASSFAIDTTNGQLKTSAALDHDFEGSNGYFVTVKVVDDWHGASDTIVVAINVTDVLNEKPATPAAPNVEPVANTTDSLVRVVDAAGAERRPAHQRLPAAHQADR